MADKDSIKGIVDAAVEGVDTEADVQAEAKLDAQVNAAAEEVKEEVKDEVEDEAKDEAKETVDNAIADVVDKKEVEDSKDVTLETLINDYNKSIDRVLSLEQQVAELKEANDQLTSDHKVALSRLAQGFRESQAIPASQLASQADTADEVVDSTVEKILEQL